jgi:hypothetical protein
MTKLFLAGYNFDSSYLNGAKGVVNVGFKNTQIRKKQSSGGAKKGSTDDTGTNQLDKRQQCMRQLANLRVSLVDTDLTQVSNNQLNFANACVVYESDSDNEEGRKNGESEEISSEEVHLQVLMNDDILNG